MKLKDARQRFKEQRAVEREPETFSVPEECPHPFNDVIRNVCQRCGLTVRRGGFDFRSEVLGRFPDIDKDDPTAGHFRAPKASPIIVSGAKVDMSKLYDLKPSTLWTDSEYKWGAPDWTKLAIDDAEGDRLKDFHNSLALLDKEDK